MSAMINAEELFAILQSLPKNEREKFFALLAEKAFPSEENFTHGEVFGQLTNAEFTAAEAANYLQVSIATFRRYVRDGKIKAASEVGTSHLYALEGLRGFKSALRLVK